MTLSKIGKRDSDGLSFGHQCPLFETWLAILLTDYQDDILPITVEIVERWGQLNAKNPMPVIDSLIAASALEYRLTVVTRSVEDFLQTDVPVVNPFLASG